MSEHEISDGVQKFCLLPELVSTLQKDLYFYAPEKIVTSTDFQVNSFLMIRKNFLKQSSMKAFQDNRNLR